MTKRKGKSAGPRAKRPLVGAAAGAPQERLPDEIKRRIVQELAWFRSPPEVRQILNDEYGMQMSSTDIIRYDATKEYCSAGEALKTLFRELRKEYVEGASDLHIAQVGYRLRRLQEMSRRAEAQGNLRLAAELLEQAAKDFGGAFTNVRNVNGRFQHEHMSAERARAIIEGAVTEAKGKPARLTKH